MHSSDRQDNECQSPGRFGGHMGMGVLAVAVAMVGFAVSACATGSPQGTADAYAEAIEAGDAERAYTLLSEAFTDEVPFEVFEARFDSMRSGRSRSKVVESLEQAAGEDAYIDADVAVTEFDQVRMTLTPSGWRIESGLFNFYGQRSPREALHSFLRAAEQRNYAVMMRFVPSSYAEKMSVEEMKTAFESNQAHIDEMIELLRQNRDGIIYRQGSRAWMDYGPYRIDFVAEGGVWKIEDPD